jgi:hypothetical protein
MRVEVVKSGKKAAEVRTVRVGTSSHKAVRVVVTPKAASYFATHGKVGSGES